MRLLLVCALACVLGTAAEASAQGTSASSLEPAAVAAAALRDGSSAAAASLVRQNRGRRVFAAGAGFVLSSIVFMSYSRPIEGPEGCSSRSTGELTPSGTSAVIMGVFGLALSAAGAARWAVEARRHGNRSSSRERGIAAGIGALTFIASHAIHLTLSGLECIH